MYIINSNDDKNFKIEIEKIKSQIETIKYVFKNLSRTKKFFQYSYLLFQNKESIKNESFEKNYQIEWKDLDIWEDLIDGFIKDLKGTNEERINEVLKDSIFVTALSYYLNNINDINKIEKYINEVKNIESKIFNHDSKSKNFEKIFYLSKNTELSKKMFSKLEIVNKYRTINNIFYKKFKNISIVRREKKIEFLKENLQHIDKVLKSVSIMDDKRYNLVDEQFHLVKNNSEEWWRIVFNTFFSTIFRIDVSDDIKLNIGKNPVKYFELRIILYLRNKMFKREDFIQFAIKVLNDESMDIGIDYGVLEVIEYFKLHVKKPKYIDDLILIHRYTYEMWKNGSKFMHFYTLHNQEHAVELIKNSIHFVKAIDYIQIKDIDYYCLFISCYLHDISMVVYPNVDMILNSADNVKVDIICDEIKQSIHDKTQELENIYYLNNNHMRKLLLECYKKIDDFFENYVRNTHVKKSAAFIRTSSSNEFIEESIKDIVAEISYSHGEKYIDVYNITSKAKDSLISIKFCKILLRLADLLDMTKDRITYPLLINSIEHMSNISAFHWISHYLIDSCEITAEYKENQEEDTSYLVKGSIEEKVIIDIKVKINNLITTDIKQQCKYCYINENSIHLNDNEQLIRINIFENENKRCQMEKCNFVCKWFFIKNEYLFMELFALKQYLSRVDNNYKTDFEVKVSMDENHTIDTKFIDKINETLDNK